MNFKSIIEKFEKIKKKGREQIKLDKVINFFKKEENLQSERIKKGMKGAIKTGKKLEAQRKLFRKNKRKNIDSKIIAYKISPCFLIYILYEHPNQPTPLSLLDVRQKLERAESIQTSSIIMAPQFEELQGIFNSLKVLVNSLNLQNFTIQDSEEETALKDLSRINKLKNIDSDYQDLLLLIPEINTTLSSIDSFLNAPTFRNADTEGRGYTDAEWRGDA